MAEIPIFAPSAVAIVETPDSFLAEGRPVRPGQLAYSGKVQLFGGHAEGAPEDDIRRELYEELGLELDEAPVPVWSGETDSQNRNGERGRRHVSLFHVVLASTTEVTMKVPGEIVRIPKTIEGVENYKNRLTDFAFRALHKTVTGEPWEEAI